MFLGKIDTRHATALPIDGLADDLGALIGTVEGRFRMLGETLASTIDSIDAMAAGLEGVQQALSPDVAGAAVGKLRQAAGRLGTLPKLREQRAGQIGTLTGRTRDLRMLLADMGELLRMLSIYGMNIKIASSGESAFVHFATGMESKLTSGQQELRQFAKELDSFGTIVREVQDADGALAQECRRISPTVPAELSTNADALERHLTATAQMAGGVAAIMQKVQAQVGRILGALQIGDSVRQRVEHCITVLHMIAPPADQSPPLPASAAAHLARLVAAQMVDIASAFRQEMATLADALARIGPLAEELLGLIAMHGDQDGEHSVLFQLERGIANVGQVTGRLHEADRQLEGLTGYVGTTIADLTNGLARIERIALHVEDISTNTRLLCRRHGGIGRAVAVIATEVSPCAGRLTRLSEDVRHLIGALATVDLQQASPSGEANDGTAGSPLEEALSIVRNACESSGKAVSGGGVEVRRIVTALQSKVGDLHHEQMFADALEASAALLVEQAAGADLDGEGDAALRAVLPRVAALYTMAQERQIHADFLLPGMEAEAAADAGTDADDDDGLF